jgi:hypothetical protein
VLVGSWGGRRQGCELVWGMWNVELKTRF